MRMMPVSGERDSRRSGVKVARRFAWLHFIASGAAFAALYAVCYSTMWGNNRYFSFFFDMEYRHIKLVHNHHTTSIDMPVLLACFLLLLGVYGVVVGVGLWRRMRWAWKWARVLPAMVLPFVVIFGWYLAEYFTLVRVDFNVSSDSMSNPPILSGDLLHAALYAVPVWLAVSGFYLWILRKSEAGAELVGGGESSRKWRVVRGMVLAAAALLVLLNFRIYDGRMLIHDTASYGWTGVTNVLLLLGQDVNARTRDRSTPLHYAAGAGRVKTVESLLDHGADINAQDRYGTTPVMAAATSDWSVHAPNADPYAAAVVLVKRGADVRLTCRDGRSVANFIIGTEDYPSEFVRMIVERGAPVNFGVNDERVNFTLLGYAVEHGSQKDVDCLLSYGAIMYPALVVRANPAMLEHLLDRGFDVNSRDEDGRTPLYYVRERDTMSATDDGMESALVLLKHGADINAQDKRDQTLLHVVAAYPDEDWVRFLLRHGADPNIRDWGDRTPFDIAWDPDVCGALKESGKLVQ